MADPQALVNRLAQASPLLAEALAKHIADNDELIARVYFGDVSRAVEYALVNAGGEQRLVSDVLAILEDHLADADEASENVIAVSFVENFLEARLLARLRPRLGPRLGTLANEVSSWRP